jgi:hypothetical protein
MKIEDLGEQGEKLRHGHCPGRDMAVHVENLETPYFLSVWRSITSSVSFTSIVT